jgi:hypothetical protein
MRKTEMTKKQLQDRAILIGMLKAAGWDGSIGAEKFDNGGFCDR